MNVERIRRKVRGGGFKPFSLRTSDGQEYTVPHPEMILIGPNTVGVLDREKEIVTLDPLHIVAIKDLPAKKNGSHRYSREKKTSHSSRLA